MPLHQNQTLRTMLTHGSAVLPGRRVVKGVPAFFETSAPSLTAGGNNRAAGTKRRRVVHSGADEALDEEGSEEEDDEEEILPWEAIVLDREPGAQPPAFDDKVTI